MNQQRSRRFRSSKEAEKLAAYVKLISAENSEIYLLRRIALQVETLRVMLEGSFRESEEGIIRFPDISTSALEKVVQYLHYKDRYSNSASRIPEFVIDPEEAVMENLEVDGTPFSILMDRAVKIKCLQLKRDRVKYDAFPAFYANTIYPNNVVSAARRCSTFQEQLDAAYHMKEAGNKAFRDEYFHVAVTKYGMAVSVFRYLENTNPNWKSQGIIEDRFIREVDYECNDETERHDLKQLLSDCYTNIALASCKLKDYTLAIHACDYAISVNGQHDKAYFVRARARLTPKNSGLDNQQLAKSDLLMSLTLNPQNREAKASLRVLISGMKMHKSKEENIYNGLFDRVEIHDQRHESKTERSKCIIKNTLDFKQRDILMGRQLARLYSDRGMYKELERIEQSIQYEVALMEKLIRDAHSMGVNLNDPQTVQLLETMKEGNHARTREIGVKTKKAKSCSSFALFVRRFKTAVRQKVLVVVFGMFISGCIVVYLNIVSGV